MLATYVVSNLNDAPVTAAGDQPGTLRQAIYDANHSIHSDDPDVIQFSPGLAGNINLVVADDVTFGPSALVINSSMRIEGNGHAITIKRDPSVPNLRLILVAPGVDLTIDSLMLSGGVAQGATGAAGQNGGPGLGGALYNRGSTTFTASTVYGNTAVAGLPGSGGTFGVAFGGAVYNDAGTVSILNSTFSGNSASITGGPVSNTRGGAVYSKNGVLTVYNSTITGDTANSGRDLYVFAENGGTAALNIYSSIIARADPSASFLDVVMTFDQSPQQISLTGENNLIRRHNLPVSISVSTDDPLLAALADNGGPTLTHALQSGSPAFGVGSNPMGLTTDQRGSTNGRTFFGRIDIGAFEQQSFVGPPPAGDYNRNQFVDAADYVAWRKNVGRTVPQFTGADGNGNGQIDTMDYLVWRSQFGIASTPSAPISESNANTSMVDAGPQTALPAPTTTTRSAIPLAWSAATFDSFQAQRPSIPIDDVSSRINQNARQEALLELLSEQQANYDRDSLNEPSKLGDSRENAVHDQNDPTHSLNMPTLMKSTF